MTIALTGATGFVGRAALDLAAQARLPVRALTRQSQPARSGVEWIAGDLADKRALAKLVRGAEAVVHVAGVVNASDAAGFEAGNVEGTFNLVDAAVGAGVPRLVFVSSLTAREPGLSAYGASKARAEKLVMASGLDWTIVRPPAVYGPRDAEMLDLFRIARLGVMPMPPKTGRSSVIHVDDLARLLLALVPASEATTHRVFEPDDGKPAGWSHYELARAIGWAMGQRPWVLHLSRASLDRAAKADRLLRRGRAKLTPDRVGYMAHPDWTVSAEAAVPEEVWRPRVATRDGLKATAKWYRENRWL